MGSLFSNLSIMLCFDVHGVNVGESERSLLIKGEARSRKKHVLLHVPKEGIYPAFPVLCPVQLNQEVREPRLCWKEILFSSCDYVKFGIFFTWGRLVCSPSPLTVICSGRFGMNLGFLCLQGSRSFCGWTGGLECVVSGHWMWKKKTGWLHTDYGFCLYSANVISLKSRKLCQYERRIKYMLFQDSLATRTKRKKIFSNFFHLKFSESPSL